MSDFSYEILDLLAKYGNDTEAALRGETGPRCLYAFSPLRENLFEWVEFETDSRILQIGSDYGSYTGLLSARAGEVVVLDERDENLEVNWLRHGKKENLRFVRGSLPGRILTEDQGRTKEAGRAAGEARESGAVGAARKAGYREYKPKEALSCTVEELMERPFDYVVMAGIFEGYGKERAGELLKWAAGFLRPGGTLLAAAENEAGVRYWMGAKAPENGFLEAEYRELFDTLVKVYGGSFTMYYPVPDYRYPSAVYSDDYLPQPGELTNISARLDGEGLRLGSEEEAMAKACRNGIFSKFSNSFLGVFKKGQL